MKVWHHVLNDEVLQCRHIFLILCFPQNVGQMAQDTEHRVFVDHHVEVVGIGLLVRFALVLRLLDLQLMRLLDEFLRESEQFLKRVLRANAHDILDEFECAGTRIVRVVHGADAESERVLDEALRIVLPLTEVLGGQPNDAEHACKDDVVQMFGVVLQQELKQRAVINAQIQVRNGWSECLEVDELIANVLPDDAKIKLLHEFARVFRHKYRGKRPNVLFHVLWPSV
mmetsp:Transcript_3688/g.6198  ORF Transcript_3688/g.6198 Transcript_3688/m.6198 type:complete len:227 (+) Transcript_3688:681-1361(+)